MNNQRGIEKRRHQRHDAEERVYFRIAYDVKTKVRFQILKDKDKNNSLFQKYPATCKNVSAEGLAFTSSKELMKGDCLHIEVYVPSKKEPIDMEGEVRWSQRLPSQPKYEQKFDTGVKLITVNGKSVLESIYHDGANQIVWSSALESVFGEFRKLIQKIQIS